MECKELTLKSAYFFFFSLGQFFGAGFLGLRPLASSNRFV